MSLLRRPRAIVLITALFVVMIVTMLLVAALRLLSGGRTTSQRLDHRELALWAANSGLEYARTRLQADYSWKGGSGAGDQTVVSQPGLLSVREANGNVVGLLDTEDGQRCQFLIRFNPQDGSENPSYVVENPYLSVNNLTKESGKPIYLGNGSGWSITNQTNRECPPRTAAITVEGRAGDALRDVTLADPNPSSTAGRPLVSRVVEAYYAPSGRGTLDGLLFGGGAIQFPTKDSKVTLSSFDGSEPRIVTGAGLEAGNGSKIGAKADSGGRISYNQSGGSTVDVQLNNIVTVDNAGNFTMPKVPWSSVPQADPLGTTLKSGLYLWRNAGPIGEALYYYDVDYEEFQSGAWSPPALSPTDRVSLNFSGSGHASGAGLDYEPVSGMLKISKDVLATPSDSGLTSLAILSEDDGSAGRTILFDPPKDSTARVSTDGGGDIALDGSVRGKNGAITSAGKIELTGSGYDLVSEPNAETSVSLYAKQDIKMQTFQAPKLTPKGKGKAAGKYNDIRITGVVYTWGDFTADVGPDAKLELKGALVAYGNDPDLDPIPGSGKIKIDAKEARLRYDARYLDSFLGSASGPLTRVMWASY